METRKCYWKVTTLRFRKGGRHSSVWQQRNVKVKITREVKSWLHFITIGTKAGFHNHRSQICQNIEMQALLCCLNSVLHPYTPSSFSLPSLSTISCNTNHCLQFSSCFLFNTLELSVIATKVRIQGLAAA